MISEMLVKAISMTRGYLNKNYTTKEIDVIEDELRLIFGIQILPNISEYGIYDYEQVQGILATLNEKEIIRKRKGVYYTPYDVVRFILFNSFKLMNNKLMPDNLSIMDLDDISYSPLCFEKSVFDPTCGAGEFLLAAFEIKMDLLDRQGLEITQENMFRVAKTIKGNDINPESVCITKLRLFLSILYRYGINMIPGIADILNSSFTTYDYVSEQNPNKEVYDLIIGNPPYVEQSKSGLELEKSYGNIYAHVLDHAARQLKDGGVFGFIIPLSYVSTPRMAKIRETLFEIVPEQYILNYSDRPDCLFTSVHQKLSILFARKGIASPTIYTGSYTYWYKEERYRLFTSAAVIKNDFVGDLFIPKLGSQQDASIYRKINSQMLPIISLFDGGENSLYLNMRATFWIKSFVNKHEGSDYKEFRSTKQEFINYAMCLFNSSLFWWYWVCVSDCWHITGKELNGFRVPSNVDFDRLNRLAVNLENKLEETKVYVGTRQTEYEYKHRLCLDEIHAIDEYINELFNLTDEECFYIKNFAYRYRISGGAAK